MTRSVFQPEMVIGRRTHSVLFPASLEKHDWSHEVWLLSCRSESVPSDCPHLSDVGSVDSPSGDSALDSTCLLG